MDLQHLIRCLGKGTDNTISTVHLLINSLLEPPAQQNGKFKKKKKLFIYFFLLS